MTKRYVVLNIYVTSLRMLPFADNHIVLSLQREKRQTRGELDNYPWLLEKLRKCNLGYRGAVGVRFPLFLDIFGREHIWFKAGIEEALFQAYCYLVTKSGFWAPGRETDKLKEEITYTTLRAPCHSYAGR